MKDYLKHWKVDSPVFLRQSFKPEDLFLGESSKLILARLTSLFSHPGGVGYIYGPSGCGKTSLTHYLLASLPPSEFEIMSVYIGARFAAGGEDWLTPQLQDFFGIDKESTKNHGFSGILSQISDIVEDQRKLVIVVDGVENFKSIEDFEPISRFVSWEAMSRPCVSFLLLGGNESLQLVKQTGLFQNLFVEIEWPELSSTDIEQFIQMALKTKKLSASLFSLNAVQELARQCQASMRRLINILEQCLIVAADQGLRKIDADLVRQATLLSSGKVDLLNLRDSVS